MGSVDDAAGTISGLGIFILVLYIGVYTNTRIYILHVSKEIAIDGDPFYMLVSYIAIGLIFLGYIIAAANAFFRKNKIFI